MGADGYREQIGRMALPPPLEPLLLEAAELPEGSQRHRSALLVAEIGIQISASIVLAACREDELTSPRLARHLSGLRRPSMGHFTGILRDGCGVLSGAETLHSKSLEPLIMTLQADVPADAALERLCAAIRRPPAAVQPIGGRMIDLLQALTTYRSRTESHPDDARTLALVRDNADAIEQGVLRILELVPITAGGTLLDNGASGAPPEIPDGAVWVVFEGAPSLPLGLAATTCEGPVSIAWYKRTVKKGVLLYAPYVQESFRRDVPVTDFEAFVSGADAASELLPDAVAALAPYRGLEPYREVDAPLFHGREDEVDRIVKRLDDDGIVVVCGPSGVGKTSLCMAGVIGRVRAESDDGLNVLRAGIVDTSPGDLAAAINEDEQTIVVVDELERLERVTAPLRREWAEALATRFGKSVRVLITLRSDALESVVRTERMRALLERHLFFVLPLDAERSTEIVLGPLRGRRVDVEDGLVEMIVRDVHAQPGALPLLSRVLEMLWESRDRFGSGLTKAAYEEFGRVGGVIRKQAEGCWNKLQPEHQEVVRRCLLLLCEAKDGRLQRRLASVEALAEASGAARGAVERSFAPFVEARLIVAAGDRETSAYQIAHDVLLTAWPELAELTKSNAEAIALHGRLREAAASQPYELWTDQTSRLRRAEELVARGALQLTTEEGAFVRASRSRVQWRSRLVRGAALVFAAMALVAGVASWFAQEARQEEQRARLRMTELNAQLLGDLRPHLESVERLDLLEQTALLVYETYGGRVPVESPERALYAESASVLGAIRAQQGRPNEALAFHGRAIDVMRGDLEVDADNVDVRRRLWKAQRRLARMYLDRAEAVSAGEAMSASVRTVEGIRPELELEYYRSLVDLAPLQRTVSSTGHQQAAIEDLQGQLGRMAAVNTAPSRATLFIDTCEVAGRNLIEDGGHTQAFELFKIAREQVDRVDDPQWRSGPGLVLQGRLWCLSGRALAREGKLKFAEVSYGRGLTLLGRALSAQPEAYAIEREQAQCQRGIAEVASRSEDAAATVAALAVVESIRQRHVQRDPGSVRKQMDWADALGDLADARRAAGHATLSQRDAWARSAITKRLLDGEPRAPRRRFEHARALMASVAAPDELQREQIRELLFGPDSLGGADADFVRLEFIGREVAQGLRAGNMGAARAKVRAAEVLLSAMGAGAHRRRARVELASLRSQLAGASVKRDPSLAAREWWLALEQLDQIDAPSTLPGGHGVRAAAVEAALTNALLRMPRDAALALVDDLWTRAARFEESRPSVALDLQSRLSGILLDSLAAPERAARRTLALFERHRNVGSVSCHHAEALLAANHQSAAIREVAAVCVAENEQDAQLQIVGWAISVGAELESSMGTTPPSAAPLIALLRANADRELGWTFTGLRAALDKPGRGKRARRLFKLLDSRPVDALPRQLERLFRRRARRIRR